MVTNNKVLTVSYGTFSCTLEGFDDSFDTMKAIAEYFRDLAADDRYFGAEPPTPDAEMLARIAEREIERRVSARTEAGAIYLSANNKGVAEAAADVAADTPQPDLETPEEPQAEAPADAPEETPLEEQAEATPDVAEVEDAPEVEAEPEVEVEDVTEEILEAVQAQAPMDEAGAPEDDIEDTAEGEIAADDVVEAVEETAEVIAEDEADFADAEIVEPEKTFEAEDDSIAAKLQRIRAVVSKSAQEPDEEDFSEDEHAESFLADTRREIESVLKLDDEMAAAAVEDDVESVAEDAMPDADPAPREVRARVLRLKKSDFEAAVSDGLLEAEPEEEDTDEIAEAEAAQAADAQDMPTSLSPEDEAELLAELAQVEAELNRSDAAAAEEEAAPVAPKRPKALSEAGTDMSRLMRETDNHMDEPEGNRRRQAIAHLRAAVAATKAEKKAGDAKDAADETEAYREDLASVVGETPKRPAGQRPAPLKLVAEQRVDDSPQEEDAAPQETAEAPRAPVRPRRVSATERKEADPAPRSTAPVAAAAASAQDFADFAENMGATRLPDVLEAAAAYLTFVEGREKFSRPQVIRMARNVDEDNCSREDTLRSFGQLLREKKIAKLEGGRFTASDSIAFKPEERAAG